MRTALNKRILRQEASVVLVEIASGPSAQGGGVSLSYLVTSKRTPRLHCFDNSAAANECFENELARLTNSAARKLQRAG
jgi:hypothetical protein